uniref:Uncharacterized protein n=1 Tax=Cacopsylla melanoneura TaxID=428564 RepID=A0A8D9BZU0_9HEMI
MLNNNFTYRIEILLIQNCLYNDRLPTYALPTVANHDINRLPCYGRLKIDHGLMLSSSTPTIRSWTGKKSLHQHTPGNISITSAQLVPSQESPKDQKRVYATVQSTLNFKYNTIQDRNQCEVLHDNLLHNA